MERLVELLSTVCTTENLGAFHKSAVYTIASNMKLYQMLSEKSMYNTCHIIHCLVTTVKIPSKHSNSLMKHSGLTCKQNNYYLINQTYHFQNMLLFFKIFLKMSRASDMSLWLCINVDCLLLKINICFLTHCCIHPDDSFPKRNPSAIKSNSYRNQDLPT